MKFRERRRAGDDGSASLSTEKRERRNADRVAARKYLLGKLGEPGRAALEQRLFEDDDFFETFLVEEEDLVDAFARGDLAPLDRARFARRLASSPGLAARVGFARDLLAETAGGAGRSSRR